MSNQYESNINLIQFIIYFAISAIRKHTDIILINKSSKKIKIVIY